MKKTINGKKYDTETALKLGQMDHDITDSIYGYTEALYRKKTGEFFVCGDGGARTKYGMQTENDAMGGSAITPLTEDEARSWAEKHIEVEEYEEIFGSVPE